MSPELASGSRRGGVEAKGAVVGGNGFKAVRAAIDDVPDVASPGVVDDSDSARRGLCGGARRAIYGASLITVDISWSPTVASGGVFHGPTSRAFGGLLGGGRLHHLAGAATALRLRVRLVGGELAGDEGLERF
jgi:hypothetical protein